MIHDTLEIKIIIHKLSVIFENNSYFFSIKYDTPKIYVGLVKLSKLKMLCYQKTKIKIKLQ